ncbi:MAG TPA: HNH endonuclease signature motif containing protein [Ilumatobacter sp.]|nr:HNH endonuclease signature motif containing protein [Ilumatobacter sp.]
MSSSTFAGTFGKLLPDDVASLDAQQAATVANRSGGDLRIRRRHPRTARLGAAPGLHGHIVPIILGADGNVLEVGRTQRIANRAQRRALRAMYPTCAFHGCDVPFNHCEIHHIAYFELGGATDLQNLLPVCSRHHHVVHDLGWALEPDQHRSLTIRDADGNVYAVVPLPSTRERIVPTRAGDAARPARPPGTAAPPEERTPERPPERPPDQLTLIA